MYSAIRSLVARVFVVSPEPPHVPPGGHGEAHVFRASRAWFNYQLLGYGARMLVIGGFELAAIAGALLGGHGSGHSGVGLVVSAVLLALFVVVGVVKLVLVRLDRDFRWYIVTDRSLRIRQGIIKFEETTLTFANVQNVSIQQGPLERWFGFANVLVETAGGAGAAGSQEAAMRGGHRGLIRGLDDASRVRDLIRAAVVRQGGAGLGDAPDEAPDAAASLPLSAAAPALGEVLAEVKALRAALGPPARSDAT